MFDQLLTVGNFYWVDDRFCPPLPSAHVRGRFASASTDRNGVITFIRDPFGLNKLFVSVDEDGNVFAGSYLIDLVRRGTSFASITSVPPGHVARLDPNRRTATLERYAAPPPEKANADTPVRVLGRGIRRALEATFLRLAAAFADRRICVCLSGGLDSGIIAALAREYFANLTGYTYTFTRAGEPPSEDAVNAEALANALSIPLRRVPASPDDVLDVLDDAICYGQDWRDFNVHCAIVNEILARAMRRDLDGECPDAGCVVLTGDLANELLADYTPISYGGREFYSLPDLETGRLRHTLVRGLDAGDREVGVFARHGLDVIQPYALVADEYLGLPGSLLGRDGFKQALSREIAGDLLPDFIFHRRKVRAQIGNANASTGILPLLVDRGCDAAWLRRAFCRIFSVHDHACLDSFIRAGRYRVMSAASAGGSFSAT
ncbi:MAG TPA: asparagine synthase-related protein [Vicinamibacterales bacterium]|nr:asparagine synthase-related protein [Vicinamibacterales bacterium]